MNKFKFSTLFKFSLRVICKSVLGNFSSKLEHVNIRKQKENLKKIHKIIVCCIAATIYRQLHLFFLTHKIELNYAVTFGKKSALLPIIPRKTLFFWLFLEQFNFYRVTKTILIFHDTRKFFSCESGF